MNGLVCPCCGGGRWTIGVHSVATSQNEREMVNCFLLYSLTSTLCMMMKRRTFSMLVYYLVMTTYTGCDKQFAAAVLTLRQQTTTVLSLSVQHVLRYAVLLGGLLDAAQFGMNFCPKLTLRGSGGLKQMTHFTKFYVIIIFNFKFARGCM